MRDLLDTLDSLQEANLSAAQLPAKKLSGVADPKTGKPFTRAELFLHKVINQSPFTTVSGDEVVIDPKETRKVQAWIKTGPAGTISLKTVDGGEVKNTQLQKTTEFGSKESQSIPVKPSDVFPSQDIDVEKFGTNMETMLKAGAFPASQLYSKISNNPAIVNLGRVGDAVIYIAKQITQGNVPEIPKDLTAEELKAIELYAGEYLGVLSVLHDVAQFDKREGFLKWVGQDLGSLLLYFPKASNNPIADSYSLMNRATGNALAISSKAAGKGAPPALTSLKIPNLVKKKYPEAWGFIDVAQTQGTGKTQPFYLMNWLWENAPESVPAAYRRYLPWDEKTIQAISSNFSGQDVAVPKGVVSAAKKRLSAKVAEGSATDGGKVFYAVISDVIRAVADGAVPNFREAILTSLGFNFVQIYTEVKGGKLLTKAFWPAKVDGRVVLKTKSSAGEDKGKIGYQVSD